MSLPVGPGRMRAGDADREQVAAFIRRHWAEGRLTNEELEQRLARAFRCRTLGDLRKLYADLPVPQTTAPQKAKRGANYVVRALRTIRGIIVAIGFTGVALAIIGAIVGPPEEERAASPPPAGPVAVQPPAGGDDPPAPAPEVTTARLGEPATDGGLELTVRRIRPASAVPLRADRGGGELAAGDNRRFFVADVRTVNKGETAIDPFCGSNGAALRVAAGEDVDLIDDVYQLEGNQTMCSSGGLQPGQAVTYTLVFKVPEGDEARRLDVWNSTEPGDILGNTRIRVDA